MSVAESNRVRCVVVTPETTVLDTQADSVSFTAYDGEIGVYPKRAPLVARLGAGDLRLTDGAATRHFFVDGGFAQVRDNVVTILTPRAKPAVDIDPGAVGKQLTDAIAETPVGDEALDDRERRAHRYRAQIGVAKKS